MINKKLLSKVAKSTLSAFLGLLLLSFIIFRQSTMTDFVDIVLKVYIYYFLIYWFFVLFLGEIINRLSKVKKLFEAKVSLYLVAGFILFLLAVPMFEYINDDVLLGISMIAALWITTTLYLRMISVS